MFLLGKRELVALFCCVLAGVERVGCLGLVVFLLGKRESWLFRFGCVLARDERAGGLGLVVFMLRMRAGGLGLVVFLLGKRELVA